MTKSIDLTKGHITSELLRLALPIFATSFIQVAYGFIDTFWIGQLSDEAVAAVGTSGYFLWLATSIALICKIGGNVTISQSVGAKDEEGAKHYIANSIKLNFIISIIYSLILIIFAKPIIGFFDLNDPAINKMAITYVTVIGLSMVFFFFNPVMSSILTAFGNSRIPFRMNSIGFILNIILDPILIFGKFGFPELGVLGAALATALSQVVVSLCFIIYIIVRMKQGEFHLFQGIHRIKLQGKYLKPILKIGLPASIQSSALACFSMVVAKFIAIWGPFAIAAQKVGAQIESISWATCEGFAVAVSTFIGQNYGAGKYERIKKGFLVSTGIVAVIGTFATFVLLVFNRQIYEVFVSDPTTIAIGISYLTIQAYSQILMCIEISSTGAYSGISKSMISAIIIVVVTFARIPLSFAVVHFGLGLDGIWWAVSLTSMLKGLLLSFGFLYYLRTRVKPTMVSAIEQVS